MGDQYSLHSPPALAAVPRRSAWNDARIAEAIGPLIGELGRWPTKGEFAHAGLSKALAAVYGHGGSRRWQERFAVVPSRSRRAGPDRRYWNIELIDAGLRELCRGRRTWPQYAEFQRAGLRGLYAAACRHGGILYWQNRLGLVPSANAQPPVTSTDGARTRTVSPAPVSPIPSDALRYRDRETR